MPSPRPTPTAIKIARGNPGKHKLNLTEPKPLLTDATAPADLPPEALTFWERIVPELVRMGTVTLADREEVTKACRLEAWGWSRLTAGTSPALALGALRDASRIWSRFGVGASDRVKITTAPPVPASKWAGLIKSA